MTTRPFPASRCRAACGVALAALVLAGCDTVPLNNPAPVVPLTPVPAAASTAAPRPHRVTPPSPAASLATAQPLAPAPAINVQPLGPSPEASTAQAPASAPAPSASVPATPEEAASSASAPAAAASSAAPATPPDAVRYVCTDRTAFLAVFGDVSVSLSTTLGVIRLEQTLSADGARYSNGDLQVWFKGREATVTNLTHPGSKTLCIEQR